MHSNLFIHYLHNVSKSQRVTISGQWWMVLLLLSVYVSFLPGKNYMVQYSILVIFHDKILKEILQSRQFVICFYCFSFIIYFYYMIMYVYLAIPERVKTKSWSKVLMKLTKYSSKTPKHMTKFQ